MYTLWWWFQTFFFWMFSPMCGEMVQFDEHIFKADWIETSNSPCRIVGGWRCVSLCFYFPNVSQCESLLLMVQKSQTTTVWMYKTLKNNGINYQPQLVSLPDFSHQQYLSPGRSSGRLDVGFRAKAHEFYVQRTKTAGGRGTWKGTPCDSWKCVFFSIKETWF